MVFICCFFALSVGRCSRGSNFLVELRPIHTWAIIRAHLSVYRNFYKFLQKRKKVTKKNTTTIYTRALFGNILY